MIPKKTSKKANRESKDIVNHDDMHEILMKSSFITTWSRKAPEKRTTFRISKEANRLIERVSNERGCSIKDVFREICSLYEDKEILSIWVSGLSEKEYKFEPSVMKTVSLEMSKLDLLNKISKKYSIERDLLVEYGAHLIMKMWLTLKATRKNMYRIAYEKFCKIVSEALEIEEQLKNILSEDDPGLNRLGLVIVEMDNFSSALNLYIKEGQEIDPEDTSQC